jgi:hypothetical protein
LSQKRLYTLSRSGDAPTSRIRQAQATDVTMEYALGVVERQTLTAQFEALSIMC